MGKCEPVLVRSSFIRDRLLDGLQQAVKPPFSVSLRISLDADDNPRVRKLVCPGVGDLLEHAFQEEIVDVHTDVMVVERDLGRTQELHPVGFGRLAYRTPSLRLPIQEDRPSLLEEREERFPVGDDPLQAANRGRDCSAEGAG